MINKKGLLAGLLLLSAIGFTFINMLANDTPPYSSMGNPALFIVFAFIPLSIGIVYCWYYLMKCSIFKRSWYKWLFPILILHIVAGVTYQMYTFDSYREMLASNYEAFYGYSDEEYILAITQGFDNQMNSQYFNVNTWFVFVSFTFLISLILRVLIQKKVIDQHHASKSL